MVLKCQVCGHNADSPGQLQQHVRTHLEVRVPGERSPTPRQSTPSSVDGSQHHHPSPQAREPAGSSSPGANGSSATPRGCSPTDVHQAAAQLRIKEEPPSDTEAEEKMEVSRNGEEVATVTEDAALEPRRNSSDGRSGNFSHSPKSPAPASVKAEPTSPTPGSSPAHVGGAMLLPQYMFNPEAAILPQASEILAKMSEMVHSRLKQGQTLPPANPAAFFPPGATAPTTAASTPPHKGATCFECDITFNNINNFYAHKRLYCSSRHHADGPVSAPAPVRDAASTARGPSASPQGGAGSRAASASPSGSDPSDPRRAEEGGADPADSADVSGGKESSSEGEGPAGGEAAGGGGTVGERASDGSQSPASEDPDDSDPNKTFCEACNIRFTHHENYTVHKRFYCASRHDPSNQRSAHAAKAAAALTAGAAGAGSAFLPQPIRTRKRKKMYEIHMARTEAIAAAAAAMAAAAASAVKQELSPGGGGGGSSPEGDGPIDLSKRPRLREATATAAALPALPLSDYHKCTACSISFNSIENYLVHKTYYCPATSLQPHTLEQLHRLHTSTSPKSRPPAQPDPLPSPLQQQQQQQHPQEATSSTSSSPSPLSSSLPPPSTTSSPQTATRGAGGPASPQVACPYCPSRLPGAELMEHFRSAHGLLVTTMGVSPAGGAGEPRPLSRVNGQVRSGAASPSASPPTNGGSWSDDGPTATSPHSASPNRAPPSLTLSPSSEAAKEAPRHHPSKAVVAFNLQPAAANPAHKTAALPSAAVHNGNSRFCRLCNIKFSSLSTFIAHKKYYCSSHSAEHVK